MSDRHPLRVAIPKRTYNKHHKNYRTYKIPLAADFNNRCGYCDIEDKWLGGRRVYHIDHFAPREKFPHLSDNYNNLVYACPYCNIAKSDDWISDDCNISIVNEEGYIDPCNEQYELIFYRDELGNIKACHKVGEYIHRQLKFNSPRHSTVWHLETLARKKKELTEVQSIFFDSPELQEKYIKLALLYDQYYEYLGDLINE